jgi:ribonuclease HII
MNKIIVGVDEAGRGPLAGPVTVAAVVLKNHVEGLNDSKRLSEKKRQALEPLIIENALAWSVVHIDVATIEEINILQASLLGMQKAVEKLTIQPDEILVDGNKCPDFSIPTQAIIGGDGKIAEISAASILAKNARDRLMQDLHQEFPEYGFDKHKGYGTKFHMQQLKIYGPSQHHRKTFAPIHALLQMEMFR